MARLNYLLLCETFTVSADNKGSIIEIYDALGYEKLPVVPLKMTFATSINVVPSDVKDGKVGTKFQICQGKTIALQAEAEPEVGDVDEERGTNLVSGIDLSGQLSFPKAGKYVAKVFLNDKELGFYAFHIIPKKEA